MDGSVPAVSGAWQSRSEQIRAGSGNGGGEGEGGEGWWLIVATHVAFLKHLVIILAVVQQPLPRVPHVTIKAEVDAGICPCISEVPGAYGHTVPGHYGQREGTPLADSPCPTPHTGPAAPRL